MKDKKKGMISVQWKAVHIISLGTRSPSRWYQCFKRVHVSCRHRNRVGSLLIHTPNRHPGSPPDYEEN